MVEFVAGGGGDDGLDEKDKRIDGIAETVEDEEFPGRESVRVEWWGLGMNEGSTSGRV